jgi:ubiquitin-protein ligase
MALHQRLLRDIAELQAKPYPNISLFPSEDVTKACLILRPNGGHPLHLSVDFGAQYPLNAPTVTIQSRLNHPNIFGNYICASILNTTEGYTSAYTLKGIAIQLLSFFGSDKLEQAGGDGVADLTHYRQYNGRNTWAEHLCSRCGFGVGVDPKPSGQQSEVQRSEIQKPREKSSERMISLPTAPFPTPRPSARHPGAMPRTSTLCPHKEAKWRAMMRPALPLTAPAGSSNEVGPKISAGAGLPRINRQLASLPDEILLLICNELDTEELFGFAKAWDRIGGERGVMTRFDLIRTRELQCFCLKESFRNAQLGVGVSVIQRGRVGTLESEFDILSLQAFEEFHIRRSVQGLPFKYWLPLPISPRHYESVKDLVNASASCIGKEAKLDPPTPVNVIYHFMNDVVVKLSLEASKSIEHHSYRYSYDYSETPQSTLKHASEKAIESYFHLFHILLCLATPAVVRSANSTLRAFLSGRRSKTVCPNLGHLLITVLISDTEMTQELTTAIIKEAVTRNVVWMLDAKGAGMSELSYMEASAVSEYRLQKTFEASKTSYRLLMFLNLLRLTTSQATGGLRKTVSQLRDEMFDRHGAPPKGASTRLANDIKRIHAVNTFPDFLKAMGVLKMPTAAEFTTFLRRSVEESVTKGYSVWGLSQEKALELRKIKEPSVEVRSAQDSKPGWRATKNGSFFPSQSRR